jgi:outer membrane protein TolC
VTRRLAALTLALAACAPTTAELRGPIDDDLARRARLQPAAAGELDKLLAEPLTADVAVRIALANNPRLAAAVDELGIAGSELAATALLGPTEVDVMARFGTDSHDYELDAIQPILGLIEAPRRRAVAHADVAAARARAEAAAVRLAARADIAYRDLLAAEQEVELRQTAFDAADAAATLRERMHDAGTATDLAQAKDRAAREQARVDLARAQADVEQARESVDTLLGLSGARTTWSTRDRVAELPADAPQLDDLESRAVAASLDLAAGRARADAAANQAALERQRSWLPELGVGVSAVDIAEPGAASHVDVGPALRIGLPLLDQRQGPRARATAELARAEHDLDATAVELRSHARAARIAALAAYDEARHLRDVVIPLRQQIVDATLQHVDAMDADPFQLIAARRDLVDAGHEYLDALRRYGDRMSEVQALQRGVSLEEPPP